jgi:hypothetical protein
VAFAECVMFKPNDLTAGRHIILGTTLCRAFLARRRGATTSAGAGRADRRDGELKMDWTKPQPDRLTYGH